MPQLTDVCPETVLIEKYSSIRTGYMICYL